MKKYKEIFDVFTNDFKIIEISEDNTYQPNAMTFCSCGKCFDKTKIAQEIQPPNRSVREPQFPENQPPAPPQQNRPPLMQPPAPPQTNQPPRPTPPPQNPPQQNFPRPEPPRPVPPPPPMPSRPSIPAGNRAVRLTEEIYYGLGNLQNFYTQLAQTSPVEYQNTFNSFANETIILRGAVAEIYRTLTGRTIPPFSPFYQQQTPSGDFCIDLRTAKNLLASLSNSVLNLIRLVDIDSINRQLIIISVTLNNQTNFLNSIPPC